MPDLRLTPEEGAAVAHAMKLGLEAWNTALARSKPKPGQRETNRRRIKDAERVLERLKGTKP